MLFEKPIVDEDFYDKIYHGAVITSSDWKTYESRAEDQINEYCNGWFDYHTMSDFPASYFEIRIKKAICAQIELFNDLGGATEKTAELNSEGTVSIGNFSYSDKGNTPKSSKNSLTSSMALKYLRPTGLLYRGVR